MLMISGQSCVSLRKKDLKAAAQGCPAEGSKACMCSSPTETSEPLSRRSRVQEVSAGY
jgi:hypothetical protein